MASESSQSSSPSLSPSPSSIPSPSLGNNVGDTFIGSFISLISKYEIRYEGFLYRLNVQDSTLGLKNVRSCGTEGRKKDGPQVPPSDRVYDYIVFRGSDIKDLQVKPSPSAQSRQEIQSEQAIDQSAHSRPGMSSPLSGYDSSYSLERGAQLVNTSALSGKPIPAPKHSSIPLSFQPPPAHAGSLTESSVNLIGSIQSYVGSFVPMPSFVQGNKLASSGVSLGMMQQPVSSHSMISNDPQIVDHFASPIMGLVNDTSQVVTCSPDVASNRSHSSTPPFGQAQLHTPSGLASNQSRSSTPPFGQARLHTPPGLASVPSNLSPPSDAQLSAPNIQNRYPSAPQAVGKTFYDSRSDHPNLSTPYELPAVASNSAPVISRSLSNSPQSFFGMDPSLQSRQQMVYKGQEMFAANNLPPMNVSSQSLASRNHAPLLPFPVSAHQSRIPPSSIEFTEEFDFEAMNEKFKKSELWCYLGKNNQRNQNDYREDTAIELNAKPAYNKDDFFDTISCNPLDRVARGGQQHIQFPEHMRQNPEAFGNNFQRPPPLLPGQGAYLAAQPNYRGAYHNNNNNNNNSNIFLNSGYDYYGGRGQGRGENHNNNNNNNVNSGYGYYGGRGQGRGSHF